MLPLTPKYLTREELLSKRFEESADGVFTKGELRYSVAGGWRIGENILVVPKTAAEIDYLSSLTDPTGKKRK